MFTLERIVDRYWDGEVVRVIGVSSDAQCLKAKAEADAGTTLEWRNGVAKIVVDTDNGVPMESVIYVINEIDAT